jgi:SAM-dependent methyltransferase
VNGFTIAGCRRCRLAYADPRPTPEQLDAVYTPTYWESADDQVGYGTYHELGEQNARRNWHELRAYAFDLLPASGAVLDIGCATGGFLAEAAANGWTVHGTDLSPEAATRAAEVNGVTVEPSTLLPSASPVDRFDLVTMWHVLEHLVDPRAVLDAVGDLLVDDGHLVIEVPNWASVGRRVRGRSWGQLRPPEHINFFTAGSLGHLVRAAGFRVVRAGTSYPSLRDRAERHGQPRDHLAGAVGSVVSELGAGGYLRIVATPVAR